MNQQATVRTCLITPVPMSDRVGRYRTRVIQTVKFSPSGAVARTASKTLASTHPAALAVHPGGVTDKPRPDRAEEME